VGFDLFGGQEFDFLRLFTFRQPFIEYTIDEIIALLANLTSVVTSNEVPYLGARRASAEGADFARLGLVCFFHMEVQLLLRSLMFQRSKPFKTTTV
jgi:hypothetical protein